MSGDGAIRNAEMQCPITAVAGFHTGAVLYQKDMEAAGLSVAQLDKIVDAADDQRYPGVRRKLLKACGLAVLALLVVPDADASPYVSLEAQVNLPQTTHNSDEIEAGSEGTFGGAVGLGYQFTPWFAAEAQIGHRSSALHGYNDGPAVRHSAEGDVTLKYGAVNVRLQAPVPYVQPYILAGAVAGWEEQDGTVTATGRDLNGSGFEPGYQLGAGVRIPLGRVSLDFGARYFEAGVIEHLGATFGVSYAW